MVFVLAFSELKPECREEFIRLAKANIPNVHREEGCIGYELTCDIPSGLANQRYLGENVLAFVECWESLDHLKRHLASPHMKAFAENVRSLRTASRLHVVSPV